MRREDLQLWLGAETPHGGGDVDWVAVDEGPHEILLDWWKSDAAAGTPDGMLFVVDDAVSQRREGVGLGAVAMQEYRFGLMSVPAIVHTLVDFDNIVVRTGEADSVLAQPLLVDNFENGIAVEWNEDALSVALYTTPDYTTPEAAQTGSRGLAIDLDTYASGALTVDLPSQQRLLGVRFRLDPNSLKASGPFPILEIFDGQGAGGGALASLLLEEDGGVYYLQANAGAHGLDRVSIPNASTVVELQWRAATSVTSKDGGVALWTDGAFVDEIAHLQNTGDAVRSVRFGVPDDGGAQGVLFLDDFESWTEAPELGAMP